MVRDKKIGEMGQKVILMGGKKLQNEEKHGEEEEEEDLNVYICIYIHFQARFHCTRGCLLCQRRDCYEEPFSFQESQLQIAGSGLLSIASNVSRRLRTRIDR